MVRKMMQEVISGSVMIWQKLILETLQVEIKIVVTVVVRIGL